MPQRISYAQNAEDIRVWRAFSKLPRASLRGPLTYVDVGANDPIDLSITASLYADGWRGLLIEADPELASKLRVHRPEDQVIEIAAGPSSGEVTFHRVPGTGLGTLEEEAAATAFDGGHLVESIQVSMDSIDNILDAHGIHEVHFMSIDVEGAEPEVLAGFSGSQLRPWVLCVEAIDPGTHEPDHELWEPQLLSKGYHFVTFDGVNRWYVADEHRDLAEAIAIPFNALDAGVDGWVPARHWRDHSLVDRNIRRRAWQRELAMHDHSQRVPVAEYERQINELRDAVIAVQGSRTYRISRKGSALLARLLGIAQRLYLRLPGGIHRALVRRRHLRHVTVNMHHLTPAPFLKNDPSLAPAVNWIDAEGLPAVPASLIELNVWSEADAHAAQDWIGVPRDNDAMLERRMDNHGDELGRVTAGLRTRIALHNAPGTRAHANGSRIAVDARSLQTKHFGQRGIGRFAKSALLAARAAVGDERCTLIIDRGLEPLPADLAGDCLQVSRITERMVPAYSVLIQPSPMTMSPDPIVHLLHSDAHKIAIVFDFIPLHLPEIYLGNAAARVEYAACLDSLRMFDEFICISHAVERELTEILDQVKALKPRKTSVAWPADVLPAGGSTRSGSTDGPIVLMTGDDPRKNTFGGLAAIGAATAGTDEPRDVVVIGMAGQQTRVHHWSIAAAFRPGEARTLDRISDEEMEQLLGSASVVVVPTFDEGLSLPVIEAIRAGAPVVASDIPTHRELIGSGRHMADATSPKALARAIRRSRGKQTVHRTLARKLARHRHASLEDALAQTITAHVANTEVSIPEAPLWSADRQLDVAVVTPWPPQASGVADYTAATVSALARRCAVTVYSTSSTDATAISGIVAAKPFDEIRTAEHDVVLVVVGNSHFHLPMVELLSDIDAVVLAHDTRMVEFYTALRSPAGAEALLVRGQQSSTLTPPLIEQIEDMRLLRNAGMWEIANRAQLLAMHSPMAAPIIAEQTGATPHVLPFANYRRPPEDFHVTEQSQRDARTRLGWSNEVVHLGAFGYIDIRTKLSDVVLESAAWLAQWGHPVALHFIGSATEPVAEQLLARAADTRIHSVEITGYTNESTFRDALLAVDCGVQLRVSPLLGVSGPLSDMAAYGTRAVASRGLCVDVDTPELIHRLPDEVSPVLVAEAIEQVLNDPLSADEREQMRLAYLDAKSPERYAEELMEVLKEAARLPRGDR